MAAFTAQDVKTLRKNRLRHDGLQKALTNADGDMDKAIDFLKRAGPCKSS